MNRRKKRLALTTISSIAYQISVVICGFVVPRLIISHFGSDINGLVQSITNFLGIITLLDLGVGAVVRSSLFKPIANNDITEISRIYVSANKFFKRIAQILIAYVCILLFAYPYIINVKFDYWFTASLIIILCIDFFAQYYFGITNRILLEADQKTYINNLVMLITLVINTAAVTVLIHLGKTIQLVKLATTIVYLVRPVFLYWYVSSHYAIDKNVTFDEEPIKQKWNGMAQHFAFFFMSVTPNILLTFLSSLANVSIYSTYSLVTNGILNFLTYATNGVFSYFGDMLAREEREILERNFLFFEWLMHNSNVLIFGCLSMVIVDFVKVFTQGVTDTNYVQPVFASLLVVAVLFRVLRLPYHYLILAAGHYKQTQSNYVIAVILNLIISIPSVYLFGLNGVSMGMLVAMGYQTVWMAHYDYKTFLQIDLSRFYKIVLFDIVFAVVSITLSMPIKMQSVTYFAWFIHSFTIFIIWLVVMLVLNYFVYREEMIEIKTVILQKVLHK